MSVKLVELLDNQATGYMSAGLYDSAMTVLCALLMIEPSRTPAIHKIGSCLEALGASEEATSCYRGAIPVSVNEKYFNSRYIESRMLATSDCSDVIYLCGFKEERVPLNPPVRNTNKKMYSEFNYKETFAKEAFCTIADKGSVWFDRVNVTALDNQGNIIRENTKGNTVTTYHSIQTEAPYQLDGTACFLDGRSSSIYYHWMLDILPKLAVLQTSGISLDEIDYFIVSARSKFQLATLKACGIPEAKLMFVEDVRLYQANRMIIPCLTNDQGEKIYHGLGVGISSNVLGYLRDVFLPMANLDPNRDHDQIVSKGVRVYISRSTRGSRNIANEPVLIEALRKRGFETVEFENLTVPEQAELMSRAEVVVGVHGAGFTNLSFCRPGTRVIEIFGDYVVPCYWALCGVAQLEYSQFMASSVSAVDTADNPGQQVVQLRDMEIAINTEEFIAYLDTILDGTASAAA